MSAPVEVSAAPEVTSFDPEASLASLLEASLLSAVATEELSSAFKPIAMS